MQKARLLTPFFFFLFCFHLFGQSTDPTVFDLSSGATFSFTSFTGSIFPAEIAVGTQNSGAAGNFTAALGTDALYGNANNRWNDEGADGISYKGGNAGERACFEMAVNATGRKNINVAWTVKDIIVGTTVNFIELQYRVGNTGGFTNVNNDLYQQGTTVSGTTFSKNLPAATDNQPLLYIRWIYYEVTTSGARSRLALDDISVSSAAVLPIELSRFEATTRDNAVRLDWETQTEANNARFIIERSTDGQNFRALETVAGAGNSFVPLNYQYTDRQPLPGRSYYRLQQVDFDGQFSYSPVKQVTVSGNGPLRLSPTLAANMLTASVATPSANDTRWTIFDQTGHLLRSGLWPAETNVLDVDIADLPSGSYFFQTGNTTERFIKN